MFHYSDMNELLTSYIFITPNPWSCSLIKITDNQGTGFDDMSSFFPCEKDDAIQYINLGYGVQAPRIVIL